MKQAPQVPKSIVRHVRLPTDTAAALNQLAAADSRTFSNYVALVLTEHVKANQDG